MLTRIITNSIIRFCIVLFIAFIGVHTDVRGAESPFELLDYMPMVKSASQQGAACHKQYLFQFDSKSNCYIYNLRDKSFVATVKGVPYKLSHCDTACFGKKKYSSRDEFPVLYVSGSNADMKNSNGYILAYRIIHIQNKWSLQLIQVIETPPITDVWAYPDALVDYKGRLWIMGWNHTITNSSDPNIATIKLSCYRMPSFYEGNIGKDNIRYVKMTNEKPIKCFVVRNAHNIQQGLCLKKNRLYIPYGYTSKKFQGIDVLDMKKGKILANYNLMGTIVDEPEAVFIYKGRTYIADQATTIKQVILK